MSGIPLPALSIKPPEDPLTGYAKALSIRGAQQQLQAGQQENQQRQMDLDSQRALMKAYHDSNGDMDKTVELAAQYGAKPQAIMQVKTAILDQKQKLATLSTDQLNNLQKQNEMVGQTAGAALQLPPEQRKAFLIQKALPQLVQNGVMKPEDAQQQIQQISGADDAGLESFLKTHQLSAMSTDKQLSEARATQAATDAHNAAVAQLPGQQATSAIKQAELLNGPSGPAAEAKYRMVIQKNQAGTATPDELAWARSYQAANQKTTTSSDTLGIKSVNTSGPSGLGPGKGNGAAPSAPAGGGATNTGSNLIDEIGQGKMAMSRLDMLLARRPEIAQAVAQKYPDFDSSKVKSYTDAYKSFTSGPDAKQVNAGAVAIQHLADMKRINDENPAEVHVWGTAPYKAFHNILDTVADELGTFYGEPKTNEVIESKKSTLGGLTNRDAAILEQARAMGIKMDEMEQKWTNAAPSKAYQAPMPGMSDKAKAARAALDPEYAQRYQAELKGGAPPAAQSANAGFSVTDPRGVVHTFKTQAQLDSFKKAAHL